MIEYILNTIKATAGQDIDITARITNDDGSEITNGCQMMLFDDEGLIAQVNGNYFEGHWVFSIPAEATEGRLGRYWYCVCYGGQNLCFREPIYLV